MDSETISRPRRQTLLMAEPAGAYAHCEAQLRTEDYDAWLAALFAPAEARPYLYALGAFALEIRSVRLRVRQAIAGEIRLQWWQDVIDGERSGEAAAHPVAAALVDTMKRVGLPASPFGAMLDAYRMALSDEPLADLPALERRLASSHGTPIRLASRVLGAGPAIDAAADHAGIAQGIADFLDDLRGDRRPPLPAGLLAGDGLTTPGTTAFAILRAAARAHLAALRDGRRYLGDAGPAFLQAALVEPRLRRGERAVDPFAPVPALPQWRRQWRLWRAARKGGAL